MKRSASSRRRAAAEGDGGDNDDDGAPRFKPFVVVDVPEVFSTFDRLSYVLSKMDLRGQTQNALANAMIRDAGRMSTEV